MNAPSDVLSDPPAREVPSVRPGLSGALANRTRPPRPGALSNVSAFAWRALLKVKHVPEQLFDAVITPIMFTVMFTYIFGGALAGSPREYLQFLLPGIMAQTVVFASMYTGVTLNTDLSKGIYDRFKSLPIWHLSPILGAMFGDFLRYTLSSTIVVLVGLLMGYRPEAGFVGVVLSIALLNLVAFGFGWIFTTLGVALRTPGTVMTFSWLFLMPLTFASNVFVDEATMPAWLKAFVEVNPVALLVSALRGILDGTVTARQVGYALIAPAALTVILSPIALALYRRKR
jgi:ABC-2 type transport system permease protein